MFNKIHPSPARNISGKSDSKKFLASKHGSRMVMFPSFDIYWLWKKFKNIAFWISYLSFIWLDTLVISILDEYLHFSIYSWLERTEIHLRRFSDCRGLIENSTIMSRSHISVNQHKPQQNHAAGRGIIWCQNICLKSQ